MRIAINGSAQLVVPNVDNAIADLRQTKDEGFTSYWMAQVGLADALSIIAATGDLTEGMEIGTAVIPIFPQHPTALARQALTTQALIPGELIVGIGASHEPAVAQWGLTWERPIGHMQQYLDVLLPILETGKAAVDGDLWTGHVEAFRPTERVPKVMLAALGPQMLDVCGARTDGTILWLVGPNTIESHIAPRLNEAAAKADRPAPRIVCGLPVCVTDDAGGARALIAELLGGYNDLPSYRSMMDREGAAGPEDVSVVGDEAEVNARLDAFAAAGTTDFAAVPLSFDPETLARTRALLAARATT